jgi:prevent-host-death family protein
MKKLKNHVSVHEAKTHLSKIINKIYSDGPFIITKSGEPVAKIIPINKQNMPRKPGKENIKISDDFNDPLPEDILSSFWK